MAFKTSGSNALKGDDSPEIKVGNGARVVSSSSDSNKTRFTIRVEDGDNRPDLQVVNGGGASTKNASLRPNLQVVNGGALGSNSGLNSNSGFNSNGDFGTSEGGFYHPDGDVDEKDFGDTADDEADQSAAESGEQSTDEADQSADTNQTGGQSEPDEADQAAESGEQSTDEADQTAAESDQSADSENQENQEGQSEEGSSDQDHDPALDAAAATAATAGAAAAAGDFGDTGDESAAGDDAGQASSNPNPASDDLGDSGNAAAAGTNPALNPENAARDAAANDLKNSEKNAAKNAPNEPGDKDAKDKENNPDSGFKNSAVGKAAGLKDKIDPRRRALNKLKQYGPVGTIVALILGVAFGLMGMQSLLPFNVSELLRTKNDSISAPVVSRAQRLFVKQLAKKSGGSGGTDEANYNVSDKQRNNLAKNGIYIVEGNDGDQMALFDDGTGKLKVVGGDDASAARLKGKLDSGSLNEQLRTKYGKSGFDIDTENIDTYKNRMSTDANFEQQFTKGSKSWGSSVATWFDKRTAQFLNRNFITRNLFKKYINRVLGSDADADTDGGTVKNRGLAEVMEEAESTRRKTKGGSGVEIDEQDFEKAKKGDNTEDDSMMARKAGEDGVKKTGVGFTGDGDDADAHSKTVAVNNAKKSLGSIATARASQAVSGTCVLLNFVGAATLIAGAYNLTQILPVVSSFLETVDKIKFGNSNAPIAEIATALVVAAPIILQEADGEYTDNVDDITENNLKSTTTEPKSAIQSEALSSLIAGTKMNPNNPVIASFNVGNLTANVGGSSFLSQAAKAAGDISLGVGMFKTCSSIKLVTNAISVVGSLVAIGGAVLGFLATGGIGALAGATIAQTVFTGLKKVGGAIVGVGVMSMLSRILVPRLATMFMRSVADTLVGENYGAALVSGAANYLGRNHLFGGGSPGSREQYIAFAAKQQEQLAKDAEYERATRSPFDYTSQYTFAGSMLKQIAILSSMSSGPTKVLSTIGTLTKNSIASLMPTAAAEEIASDLMTPEEFEATCPSLASIGAYGDAFCNPYIISDYSTMDIDPDEVKGKISDSFNDGAIKNNSELAKYIDYCSGRSSNFGIIDGNIANQFTKGSTGSAIGDALVGVIPVYGDLLDVFTEGNKMMNIGWITGEQCVATNDGENGWGSKTKYYQRYVEDERLKESIYGGMGSGDTGYVSPVTAYIEKRDLENPIDNSPEGVLARYSGLTKEQVVATLDYMDYLNYIADYDSSERYAFGEDYTKLKDDIYFEIQDSGTVFAANYITKISYADIRNRIAASA